jgi:hypothetical protein
MAENARGSASFVDFSHVGSEGAVPRAAFNAVDLAVDLGSGRTCPLAYRYAPSVFAREADMSAETIYVVGGLYGNLAALGEIERMAARERVRPTIVFNGDFHWFDVNADDFAEVNTRVGGHVALRGNVETELADAGDGVLGCGCAYPEYVSDEDVARSNKIMQRLHATAARSPSGTVTRGSSAVNTNLGTLPMHAVAQVGEARIGIVHGDAESLAGWRFAHEALHEAHNQDWLHAVCVDNKLSGFASSHTCLPTLRQFSRNGRTHFVANNGAAGMPNFGGTRYGLLTRISCHPLDEGQAQYGIAIDGVFIDAIPIHYDHEAFVRQFLCDWPPESDAYISYAKRIAQGPAFAPPHALGLVRAPAVCA